MGLDLIPTADPCVVLKHLEKLPGVAVDWDEFSCPLERLFPFSGMLTSSCSCRGKAAAWILDDFGYDESASLYGDCGPGAAIELGTRLNAIAEELRERFPQCRSSKNSESAELDPEADAEELIDGKTVGLVSKEIETLEQTAKWYIRVGELGSGVHAWS